MSTFTDTLDIISFCTNLDTSIFKEGYNVQYTYVYNCEKDKFGEKSTNLDLAFDQQENKLFSHKTLILIRIT